MKISVVIPVLNERANLPAVVESVRSAIDAPEIIIVDGGSTDGSREWLSSLTGIHVIESARGKGFQQNAGGKNATGEVVLFLHADCRLRAGAGEQIAAAMSDARTAGGCFTACWNPSTPALHVIAFGMNLRTVLFRRCYGDQAIFVRRSVFQQIGGFPDWPLFEDAYLVRRMKMAGRFRALGARVEMSSRRFEKTGILRGIFLVYFLQIGFLLGVPPARLKKWFIDIRPHLEGNRGAADSKEGSVGTGTAGH
jgi:rSAM/selenodomain-associated transferase 2